MSNQRLGIEARRVRRIGFRSISSCVLPLTGACLAFVAACGPTRSSQSSGSAAGGSAAGSSAAGSAPLPLAAAGAVPSATASGGAGGSAGQAAAAIESGGTAGSSSGGSGGSSAGAAGVGGLSAGSSLPLPTQLIISGPNNYWHSGTLNETDDGDADLVVDGNTTYQTFDGFGGTFNELSWRYLSLLSESDRAKALQLLFGADGARFVFGRLPIGANEYAADRYTLDMTDANTPDPQLEKFSIQRDLTGLVPYVKAALALRPNLRFLAVPWTPPTWMKTNGDYDGGTMKDDPTTLTAFALYLSKYVQEYGKQGIDVEAIAVQREPSFTENSPSCLWSVNTYTKFVQTFLPETFSAQNVHAQLYLGLMENNMGGSTDTALVDAAMNDSKLMKFFSGFGFEWGMVDQVPRVTSSNLPIVQTEHLPGNFPWLSSFQKDRAPNDYIYATESWKLISQWLKAGATAYITKHLVLDSVGQGLSTKNWPQNSLLVVDTATHALTVTPAFYVFQHFSRFIAPGATRKAALTQLPTLDVLAFENPDRSVAAVMFNSGAERELSVVTGGTRYGFTLPANSFATVFKAAPAASIAR